MWGGGGVVAGQDPKQPPAPRGVTQQWPGPDLEAAGAGTKWGPPKFGCNPRKRLRHGDSWRLSLEAIGTWWALWPARHSCAALEVRSAVGASGRVPGPEC